MGQLDETITKSLHKTLACVSVGLPVSTQTEALFCQENRRQDKEILGFTGEEGSDTITACSGDKLRRAGGTAAGTKARVKSARRKAALDRARRRRREFDSESNESETQVAHAEGVSNFYCQCTMYRLKYSQA